MGVPRSILGFPLQVKHLLGPAHQKSTRAPWDEIIGSWTTTARRTRQVENELYTLLGNVYSETGKIDRRNSYKMSALFLKGINDNPKLIG